MDITTEETARGKVWKLRRADIGLHKITISATELISLSMVPRLDGAADWYRVLAGDRVLLEQIRDQLPEGVWDHYQRYRKTIKVIGLPSKSYDKQQGMLRTVNRAIAEHRVLEIEYDRLINPVRSATSNPMVWPFTNPAFMSQQ